MNSTIFGRIGQNAELKESNSGTKYARFSVALNTYDKNSGKGTTWCDATVFGSLAESMVQYLTVGSAVALSGDLKLHTFDSQRDGGTQTKLQISVNSLALLGAGQNGNGNTQTRAATVAQSAKSSVPHAQIPTEGDDPDIPF